MKKWMLLPALALLSGALMADDLEIKPVMWRVGNAKATECAEFLRAEALNSDPLVNYTFVKPLDCARINSITFDLQIPATKNAQTTQIFWNTSESKGLKEAASLRVVLAKDGKMHRYTAVLAGQPFWGGTLKELRIDPMNAKLPFTLGKVELEKDVKLICWQGPTVKEIEKDEVTGFFTAKTFKDPNIFIRIPGKGFPAAKFAVLEFELALDPGCVPGGQFFWAGDEVKMSEKASLKYRVPADGKFHKVKLDLAVNPAWKGKINYLRIDMTHNGVAGKGYRLKDVELKLAR